MAAFLEEWTIYMVSERSSLPYWNDQMVCRGTLISIFPNQNGGNTDLSEK